MTLNTAFVLERGPIYGEPMEIDGIDPFSELPMDIVRVIFQAQKADLPAIALVCKKWKALADDEGFRQMIRPAQAFGTKEWQKYIGVEVEAEPRLPRHVYGDLEREGGFLTFIPDIVKVTKENGIVEEVILDNLEAIGNLIEKPKTNLETCFRCGNNKFPTYFQYWFEKAIQEKRPQEKSHWVWIKKEVIGKNTDYDRQQSLAKSSKGNISGLIDIVIAVLMEYVRSNERHFILDPGKNRDTLVRVKEKCSVFRMSLGFKSSGIYLFCTDDDAFTNIGFALARKSF